MTDTADRIAHRWGCLRPPAEDYYRVDRATGLPVVVKRCPSCGATERGKEDSSFPTERDAAS